MIALMQKLVRESAVYALGALTGKAVALVMLPILTRALSSDDFGRFEVLFVLASALTSTLLLGVDRAALRQYFDRLEGRRVLLASWYGIATLAMLPVVFICIVAAGPISALLFGTAAYARGVAYTGGIAAFCTYQFLALSILRAERRPAAFAALTGATLALYMVIAIGLIFAMGPSVDTVLLAALVAWGASAVVGSVVVRAYVLAAPSLSAARALLRVGLPLAPAVAVAWGAEFANRVIVLGVAGPTEVAYLGLGLRAASVAGLAVTGLQLAWEPHAYAAGTSTDALARLARDARRSLVAVATTVVAVSLIAHEGLVLVSGERYLPALPTLGFSFVATLAAALFVITSTPSALAVAMGDLARASIAGIAIGLVATAALTGPSGAAGAACGIALGQLSAALTAAWLGRHRLVLPVAWGMTSIVLASAALIAVVTAILDLAVVIRLALALAFAALLVAEGSVGQLAGRVFMRARA